MANRLIGPVVARALTGIPATEKYFRRGGDSRSAGEERVFRDSYQKTYRTVYDFGYRRKSGRADAESRDGGETWSEAVETEFKNPNSAVDFIKLQNGHLLLVYNDNMNDRTPLTVAISMDGDKTWSHRRNIAGGDNTFAYPYAIQTRDGKIHIVYTTNTRTTILHAVFDEYAIIGKEPEL